MAGYFAADQAVTVPADEARRAFKPQTASGPWLWTIVQNVSAVAGIVPFLVQIVQWRRYRGP